MHKFLPPRWGRLELAPAKAGNGVKSQIIHLNGKAIAPLPRIDKAVRLDYTAMKTFIGLIEAKRREQWQLI